jgi:DNA-binding NtrC family response regulator
MERDRLHLRAAHQHPRRVAVTAMATTPPLKGMSILIVEDEAIIGMMLAAEIGRAGATPIGPVASVAGALKVVEARPIDVVILDAKLIDGSSAELATYLEERHIPYVVVSGYEVATLPRSLRDAPFVAKPISTPLLIDTIKSLGAASRLRQLPGAMDQASVPNETAD